MRTTWLPASLRQCTQCSQVTRPILSQNLAFRPSSPKSLHTSISHKSRRSEDPVSFDATSNLQHDSTIDEDIVGWSPIMAAPEIRFPDAGEAKPKLKALQARLVPASPSYFTGSPVFTDGLLHLRSILRKHATVPTCKPGEHPRVSWRTIVEYRNMVGEAVPTARYSKITSVLQRLNQINPALMPKEVREAIEPYKRDFDPLANVAKPIPIDKFGRALGVGRRKASTARAWLVEGTGEVLVNGKTLANAFARVHDRESVVWALKVTDRVDKYNLWALAEGGGTTGQAEALTLAVSKALMIHEPGLKPALRRAGVVTRDPRRVERKKPGRTGARTRPQWVRR